MVGFSGLLERFGASCRGIGSASGQLTGLLALLLFFATGAHFRAAHAQTVAEATGEAIVIEGISLRQIPGGAAIDIAASATPRWTIRYDQGGGFVLRMPGSVVGREIPDLEFEEGLVAEIRVQQVLDPVQPSILVVVVARERLRVAVRPEGSLLRVRLSPVDAGPTTPTDEPEEATEPPLQLPDATAAESLAEPDVADELDLVQELELLRSERDALALGNPTYLVADRAEPCLYLRSAPEGRELDCVNPGTRLILLGLEGAWGRVRLDDRLDAWARLEYLEPAPAQPSSEGERGLLDQVARLSSELTALRDENLELREAATTAQENLERAWEAQQILSARLVEESAGGDDVTAELERLSEGVERLTAEKESLTAELERRREEADAAAIEAQLRLEGARAERDELARLLDESRNALTLGSSTYVVLPTAQPCLNLRPRPGAETRVDCLPPGTRLALLELRGDWARARLPQGADGWVAQRFLEAAPATPEEVRQLANAQAELERLASSSEVARAQLSQARDELAELRGRVRLSSAESERLRSELEASSAEATRLRLALDQAAGSQAALRESAATAQTALQTDLDQVRAELEARQAAADRRQSNAETEITSLRGRLTDSESRLAGFRERIERLEAELDSARTAAADRESESEAKITAVRSEMAELDAETAAARQHAAELEQELAAARTTADERQSEADTEIEALRARLAASEAGASETRLRATELGRELAAVRDAAGKDEARAEESSSKLAAAEGRISELENAIAAERTTLLELRSRDGAEAEALRKELVDTGNDLGAARERLARLEAELAAARSASTDQQTAAETEMTALRARVEESEADAAATRRRISELERDLETARTATRERHAGAETEIESLRAQVESAEASATEARQRIAELELELETASSAATSSGARTAALSEEVSAWKSRATEAETGRADAEARLEELNQAMELGASAYAVRGSVDPCLNLRVEPGDGAPIDCLVPATRLTLLEVASDWARARLGDGVEGWLARAFIEPAPIAAAELAALEAELAELRATSRTGYRELEASAAAAAELASRAETRVLGLTEELEDERTRNVRLEGELEAARNEAAKVIALRTETDAVAADLTETLEASRAEVVRLTDSLESAQAETESARLERRDLEQRLAAEVAARAASDSAAERTSALDARIVEMRSELEAAQAENQTLRERSEQRDREMAALERVRNVLEAEREVSADLQRRLDASMRTLSALETDVDPIQSGEPLTAAETEPDLVAARALVQEWARAWSDQRVDDYLAFYSSAFVPADGSSLPTWAAQRRERLTAPRFIEVSLTEIDARVGEAGELSVEFTQSYRSNTFNDAVRKTLVLAQEDGAWKIVRELSR